MVVGCFLFCAPYPCFRYEDVLMSSMFYLYPVLCPSPYEGGSCHDDVSSEVGKAAVT